MAEKTEIFRTPMKKTGLVLLTTGLCWLAVDVGLMFTNIVLRGLPLLRNLAAFLDTLPSRIGNPIFILLWEIFLFGWLVPLGLGIRSILRYRAGGAKQSSRSA
jgi:hypothetical protein